MNTITPGSRFQLSADDAVLIGDGGYVNEAAATARFKATPALRLEFHDEVTSYLAYLSAAGRERAKDARLTKGNQK